MPKISIIIPIYNTPQSSLVKCLDSIKNQPYSNYELILIDDGSRSDLSQIYSNLSQKYSATYLYQPNKGVSSARNHGINEASGDYIAFIDSDDTIMPDFLPDAAEYAASGDYDIVIGSIQDVSKEYSQAFVDSAVSLDGSNIYELENALLGGIGPYYKFNPRSYFLLGSSCGRIYKTSVIKGSYYQDGLKYSEDQLFNRIVFKKVTSAIIVPDIWYNYLQNDFSAMHGNYENYRAQICVFWKLWNDITITESNLNIANSANILSLRWFNGFTTEWIIPLNGSLHRKITEMKKISEEEIFIYAINNLPFKMANSLKDRITYLMLKFHWFVGIYFINSLNHFLMTTKNKS
ncbi:glycosyltransferase family 2 protein [Butyrivibrio fibrisolvens]|uniref:glycosyltransferase family 2 protein n=1 Tax=Butyrivibrio fibrisolvens TaxID=831 RepID=UPI0020BE1031|nr:glycosyltransferase family 2 protein [Butyrivibrio fibrisolvens]